MDVILEQFDAIASNVGRINRLQEECDVLSLVLTKYPKSKSIDLQEFKLVLLPGKSFHPLSALTKMLFSSNSGRETPSDAQI